MRPSTTVPGAGRSAPRLRRSIFSWRAVSARIGIGSMQPKSGITTRVRPWLWKLPTRIRGRSAVSALALTFRPESALKRWCHVGSGKPPRALATGRWSAVPWRRESNSPASSWHLTDGHRHDSDAIWETIGAGALVDGTLHRVREKVRTTCRRHVNCIRCLAETPTDEAPTRSPLP